MAKPTTNNKLTTPQPPEQILVDILDIATTAVPLVILGHECHHAVINNDIANPSIRRILPGRGQAGCSPARRERGGAGSGSWTAAKVHKCKDAYSSSAAEICNAKMLSSAAEVHTTGEKR